MTDQDNKRLAGLLKVVDPKRATRVPATDHDVGMRPLTGRTVTITGRKVNGERYIRTLSNCSYVPGRGMGFHRIEGLDIATGTVKTFRLIDVETLQLRLGGPVLKGADLVATIDHHLRNGQGAVEQVYVDEAEVAA